MFTGIIEGIGEVVSVQQEESNVHFELFSPFTHELKIDQSVAHNGCCLTVVKLSDTSYTVTAIKETLDKTNLRYWKAGTQVNIERCMQLNGRLDGHIVQGHVDTVAECVEIIDQKGSWKYKFTYSGDFLTVEKGSITVNGSSLTVVDSERNSFSVCIIPYTFENTNFKQLNIGDKVNIEFDVIGKYVQKLLELNQ
ncbi:MAG TPA: riboflavin synthase [Crocinitomicaceae bacterium]|nr:riboflavin synthase [Flavobacteriales bacterium]HBW86197.1 riboflavin synthase [Crocinitomicaceae bacterium]